MPTNQTLNVLPDDESAGEPFTCLGGCGRTLPPSEAAWETGDEVPPTTCIGCADRLAGPRFQAIEGPNGLTVRDNELGQVITHQKPWGRSQVEMVEESLNAVPRRVALFTWELAG